MIDSQRSSRKNSKKRLSAKRRQAQKNYKIYLYDFCIHIYVWNTPMEDMSFFDRKILGRLLKSKVDTATLPPIGYRVPASRHWFVQAQRNGGSEIQSRRFI